MRQEQGFDFEAFQNRRAWKKVGLDIGRMNERATEVADDYRALVTADPLTGIDKLGLFLEEMRDINPNRSFVEAVAAGPNPEWTGQLLALLGTRYSYLDRDTRSVVLTKGLGFLDRQRYDISQGNVSYIDNPHLAADIAVSRPLYWPGFEEYTGILTRLRTWDEIEPQVERAKSTFWLSLAITRPDMASDDVRNGLERIYPTLLDKTLDAIAAITAERAVDKHRSDGTPVEEYTDERIAKYDSRYSDAIRTKIVEHNWIRLE
ncbi:MAG: hypothetical protein AAB478_02130 [Patescibacteria group bacterium]